MLIYSLPVSMLVPYLAERTLTNDNSNILYCLHALRILIFGIEQQQEHQTHASQRQ
jgi:hypothetical protein